MTRDADALLLAIKPIFVARILGGAKRIELRRGRLNARVGQVVLIYSSSPEMALVASAVVGSVEIGTPSALWKSTREAAGVTRSEYDAYFDGAEHGTAIWLENIKSLATRFALAELRRRWPWFYAPQSYRFVSVVFKAGAREIASLAPRVVG